MPDNRRLNHRAAAPFKYPQPRLPVRVATATAVAGCIPASQRFILRISLRSPAQNGVVRCPAKVLNILLTTDDGGTFLVSGSSETFR